MRYLILGLVLFLGACQTPSRYVWGNYASSVYATTSGEESDVAADIQKLEVAVERARTSDRQIPPGMHAHLGMLHGSLGNLDQAQAALESEKELYPESGVFIDGLLTRMGAATREDSQ